MKRRVILCALLSGVLVSCEDFENNPAQSNSGQLNLSVQTQMYQSKGVHNGEFQPGDKLGVFVVDQAGESYEGRSYDNVPYEMTDQGWVADSPVMLSSKEARLMVYWPYDSKVDVIHSVPVTSDSQTDFLYSIPTTGLTKYNSTATVRLCHAMACLKAVLVKGTYAGSGNVTSVSVSGEGLPTAASLDAETGELSSFESFGGPVSVDTDLSLSYTPQICELITLPTSGQQSLMVSVTIDGEARSVAVDKISLVQGRMTQLTLVVNDSEIVVSGVSLQDWTFHGETYDVHIAGNTEGVAFTHYVAPDGAVTVTAVPIEPSFAVGEVSVEGNCVSEQVLDPDTGVRTIELSQLQEDVTLRFSSSWSTVFRQLFRIGTDSVDKTITLFNASTLTQLEGLVDEMVVDGVPMPFSQYHVFTSSGDFWVEVDIPADAEVNVAGGSREYIVEVEVPFSTKTLSDNAFSSAQILSRIVLPGGLTSIGSYAFKDCKSLSEINLPDAVSTLGRNVFWDCVGLRSVSLGNQLNKIGVQCFIGCTSLESIEIPASVTVVDKLAFSSCTSLKRAVFRSRSGETIVKGPVFSNCPSLESLVLPVDLIRYYEICADCPALTKITSYDMWCNSRTTAIDYAFEGLPEAGVLCVPEGAKGYEDWMEDLGDGWRMEYF